MIKTILLFTAMAIGAFVTAILFIELVSNILDEDYDKLTTQ